MTKSAIFEKLYICVILIKVPISHFVNTAVLKVVQFISIVKLVPNQPLMCACASHGLPVV